MVCGVSSLGIDHTSLLGDTMEKIAWQKGGIFKVTRRPQALHVPPTLMAQGNGAGAGSFVPNAGEVLGVSGVWALVSALHVPGAS